MVGKDYIFILESLNGYIKLGGNKVIGIVVVVKSIVGLNKVNVINKGIIEIIFGEKIIGIYGKGVNIENVIGVKINIGVKGVGIYIINDNSFENIILNNVGEINLIGDEVIGLVVVKVKIS